MCEFLINDHRITFYSGTNKMQINGVEIEEFKNQDFVSRVFMNHEDFKTLIKNYERYEKNKEKG